MTHYKKIRLCPLILIIVLPLLVTSCARVQPAITANNGADQVSQAAVATSKALQHMAEVEQAAFAPGFDSPPPNFANYGLGQKVSVDWSGPVEGLVREIAAVSGYKMRVVGAEPAVPVLVDIYARNQPIGDILRNAGYQTDQRANVVILPDSHYIEVRYPSS